MAPKFAKGPDLKRFMVRTTILYFLSHTLHQEKRLRLSLNGKRKLIGTLRGYDAFLNVVLEEASTEAGEYLGQVVIRGNSIVQFEGIDRIEAAQMQ